MHLRCSIAAALAAGVLLHAGPAAGQPAPLNQVTVPFVLDSGPVLNAGDDRAPVYSAVVEVPDATSIRLRFDEATLGTGPADGVETVLRITSLADGAVQTHTSTTLLQWGNTSAYFNGNAVKLELIAEPGAERSRIRISEVMGVAPGGGAVATICGPVDDRVPSADPRVARTVPGGCTAWLISDTNNCFLTAGHCVSPGLEMVEFNVPLSLPDGTVQHPGPEDQYPVDPFSVQFVNGGVGNDWCYFGTLSNSETGMTAFEVQGSAFDLGGPPPVAGQSIRITGHGTDTGSSNQIQQTHAGPYVNFSVTTVQYVTDTTGGNSGSPVINDDTGIAIGIHTHGGCNEASGQNSGTGSNNAGLQNALSSPAGICLPVPVLAFSFPDGIPSLLDPAGDTIRVVVTGQEGGAPQPSTGQLHYDAGGGLTSVAMQEISPNEYDAVFPATECGSIVSFYFSAETTEAEMVNNPLFAPSQTYSSFSGVGVFETFIDDFEVDTGWTVHNTASDGQWERAVPLPLTTCNRGNPGSDADGSGQCYVTDNSAANSCNSDVDSGSTVLTSPPMDGSDGLVIVSYYRWFSTVAGGNPFQDIMVVDISNDNGVNWVNLETVGPSGVDVEGGWYEKFFFVGDVVTPTDMMRLRFTVSDTDPQSVVEAGVDGVAMTVLQCDGGLPCPWDCGDGNGDVDTIDFLQLLGDWGLIGSPCDFNGNGVDTVDFLDLLGNWGPCP